MIKLSTHNTKIIALAKAMGMRRSEQACLDLPAGWSCPGALECKSKADRMTGELTDGQACRYRCYAASNEAAFPQARALRWHNFDILKAFKSDKQMSLAILASLPEHMRIVRLQSSGDIFNRRYMLALLRVARERPDTIFYGYTKNTPVLPPMRDLPMNLRIVVSAGGKFDDQALEYPRVYVCDSVEQAQAQYPGLPVYTDEQSEMACMNMQSFVLIIHGTQPKHVNERIRAGQES